MKVGFGFVEYEDRRDAEDALRDLVRFLSSAKTLVRTTDHLNMAYPAQDGAYLLGKRIAVEWAKGERGAPRGSRCTYSCLMKSTPEDAT